MHEATAHFYAAPEYLERKGRPRTPADTADHDFIAFGPVERMLGFLRPLGFPIAADNFRLGSENGLVAWEFVRRGLGIAPMSDAVAALAPGVEPLFPRLQPIVFPVWLTAHREVHGSRRIRIVFDLLAEHFATLGR